MAIREEVEVTLDESEYLRSADKIEKANEGAFGKGAQKKTESLTAALIKSELAVKAMSSAYGFLKQSLQDGLRSARDFERTTKSLTVAVGKDAVPSLQRFFAEMESVAGISDETTRRLGAMAANMGVAADDIDPLIRASIRLSNSLGGEMSVDSAARNLIKSLSGMKGELGESVSFVRDMTAEQLESGEAIQEVNRRFKDQLGLLTEGDGYDAQITKLTNAWSSFSEAVVKSSSDMGLFSNAMSVTTTQLAAYTAIIEKSDLSTFDKFRAAASIFSKAATTGGDEGEAAQFQFETEAVLANLGFSREEIGTLFGRGTKKERKFSGSGGGGGGGGRGGGRSRRRRRGSVGVDIGAPVLDEAQPLEGVTFMPGSGEGMEIVELGFEIIEVEEKKAELIQSNLEKRQNAAEKEIELEQRKLQAVENAAKEEQELRERVREAQMRNAFMVANQVMGLGEQLLSHTNMTQRQMFEAKRGFAIANAVLAGAQGVANTMGAYPFPYNAILAGIHAAMAASQIVVVASQKYDGGSGGGGSVAAPSVGSSVNGAGMPDVAGSAGAGGGLSAPRVPQVGDTVNESISITVVGSKGLSDADVKIIQDSIERSRRKGMSQRGAA